MKQSANMKRIRRCVLAAALIITLLVPAIYAITDYTQTVGVAPNLTAAPLTDAENLFRHMMNQMMPVGHIFVTTDIATVEAMEVKYGGTWERWGEGRAPMGTDGPSVEVQGGDLRGTAYTGLAISGLSLTPAGNITLSAGGAALSNGGVSLATDGTIALTGPGETFYSNYRTLVNGHIPTHTHDYRLTVTHNSPNNGDWTSTRNVPVADPGSGTVVTFNGGTVNRWGAQVNNAGKNPADQFRIEAPLRWNTWTGRITTNPTVSLYTPPTPNYTPHYFSSSGTLTATAAQLGLQADVTATSTANWTDQTIQPYVVVYMYKRTAIEDLVQLPVTP